MLNRLARFIGKLFSRKKAVPSLGKPVQPRYVNFDFSGGVVNVVPVANTGSFDPVLPNEVKKAEAPKKKKGRRKKKPSGGLVIGATGNSANTPSPSRYAKPVVRESDSGGSSDSGGGSD